jgi:CopG antitoxin of type II toxin-antitoxin system
MAKKLTVVLERETRDAVQEWAAEEQRPVSNLLRRIIDRACEQHRASREQVRAA